MFQLTTKGLNRSALKLILPVLLPVLLSLLMSMQAGVSIAHDSHLHAPLTDSQSKPQGEKDADLPVVEYPLNNAIDILSDIAFLASAENSTPVISSDAHVIIFQTDAQDIAGGNPAGVSNLMLYDVVDASLQLITTGTEPANGSSESASVSGNGDLVAFESSASNLVNDDENSHRDIFLFNRTNSDTRMLSRSFSGESANGNSHSATIASEGRYVTFISDASNLVEGDDNNATDIFVHDLSTGQNKILSHAEKITEKRQRRDSLGELNINGNGRFIVFSSYDSLTTDATANGNANIYLYDQNDGSTQLITSGLSNAAADGSSFDPAISDNGRYIVFASRATNLVEGIDGTGSEIYLIDQHKGVIRLLGGAGKNDSDKDSERLVAGDSSGAQISSDGKFVLFQRIVKSTESAAPSFDLFLVDIASGEMKKLLETATKHSRHQATLSESAGFVTFTSLSPRLESQNLLSSVFAVKVKW